ncbi:MAG: radical SAM protein, partial [Endomicrobiaceae bacterium]
MEKVNFVWDSHYRCNFRCPYCWFDKTWDEMDKLNKYPPLSEMIALWDRLYDMYGECHLMITGGEPMLYPNIIELIEAISKKHTVKVTCQLSGDMFTFARKLNPERVSLDMNFHPLESKLEPFIKKVLYLYKYGFKGGVCYLAYPPNMDKIKYYDDIFKKYGIVMALAAFHGEYAGKQYPDAYTKEEREMMMPYLGDIDRQKYHLEGVKTKGKLCR